MGVSFLPCTSYQSLREVETFINGRWRILVDEVQWVECLRSLRNQLERIEYDNPVAEHLRLCSAVSR